MAKEAPTMTVAVDDSGGSARSIENDLTSVDWSIPRGVQDVTGVDKSGIERLLTLADFSATLNGVFDDGANMSLTFLNWRTDVLSTVRSDGRNSSNVVVRRYYGC